MKRMRTIGAVGVSLLVTGSLLGSSQAQAARPESYQASASGQALELSIAGVGVNVGGTTADLDSVGPKASTTGDAVKLPLLNILKSAAKVEGAEDVSDSSKQCPTGEIPPLPVGLVAEVSLLCATSKAKIKGGMASASSSADAAEIELQYESILLGKAKETLMGLFSKVIGGGPDAAAAADTAKSMGVDLNPLAGKPINDALWKKIFGEISTISLLSLELGSSESMVEVDGSKVKSAASSDGFSLNVLPNGLCGQDILSLKMGHSEASASYDRKTAKSNGKTNPEAVQLSAANPADCLGEGRRFEILDLIEADGTLQIKLPIIGTLVKITFMKGTTVVTDEGPGKLAGGSEAKSASDVFKVEVLPGLAGGAVLSIGNAQATAGGAPAIVDAPPATVAPAAVSPTTVVAPTTTPTTVKTEVKGADTLPRTGGDAAVSLAGLGLLGLAFGARRLARRGRASV
ncbi:MAG: hypothetical protein HYR89_04080 [Actinobacteria bacterium]|nr:hypothetical protein [Actinomycetota bacterium]